MCCPDGGSVAVCWLGPLGSAGSVAVCQAGSGSAPGEDKTQFSQRNLKPVVQVKDHGQSDPLRSSFGVSLAFLGFIQREGGVGGWRWVGIVVSCQHLTLNWIYNQCEDCPVA